ncbi:hypothetical protein PHYSODRAFT_385923, partial [Phytophthora sojae]
METYHPVELKAYAQQAEQAARGNGRSRSSGRGADDERKKKLRKITPQQQVHLNKLLAAWIAHHFRPMIIHYLDETIASLRRNELDAVRAVVQRFRTLAVYFRKSPKGNNRLSALQVDNFNVKAHEV